MENWVVFLDLLGTKESSRTRQGLERVIKDFRDQVIERESLLGEKSSLYHFSDCIFLQIPLEPKEILPFFNWLLAIQKSLFERGYFFKCAVAAGNLGPLIHHMSRASRSSIAFVEESAIRTYEMHERFKGIGIVFNDQAVMAVDSSHGAQQARVRKEDVAGQFLPVVEHLFAAERFSPFVRSFYVPTNSDANKFYEVELYWDLRMHPSLTQGIELDAGRNQLELEGIGQQYNEKSDVKPVEPEAFRQIVSKFITANLKSDQYGRYYMSLICTLVASSNYSGVNVVGTPPRLKGLPLICKKLLTRKTLREIEKVPGFPYLVFRMVGLILSGLKDFKHKEAASNCLAGLLNEHKSILRHIRLASDEIIASENKELLLSAFGESILDE